MVEREIYVPAMCDARGEGLITFVLLWSGVFGREGGS